MRHSVPDKDDVTPTRRARGSSKSDDSKRIGELEESVQLLEKLIGELRLEVGTCRVLLRLVGVTQQEFDLAREQLKKDWNPAADIGNRVVQQSAERRTAEKMRELLAGRGRTTKGH